VLYDAMRELAMQEAGGTLCQFAMCAVTECMGEVQSVFSDVESFGLIKNVDILKHVFEVRNLCASRYHALASSLMRYSAYYLPPGSENQLIIEGWTEDESYPATSVGAPDVMQLLLRAQSSVSSRTSRSASALGLNQSAVSLDAAASVGSSYRVGSTVLQMRRTGGCHIWVKLPVWCTPSSPCDGIRASMKWLVELAAHHWFLGITIDTDCSVLLSGGNVSDTLVPQGAASAGVDITIRHVRLSFSSNDEVVLEVAAERFCRLLAAVHASMSKLNFGNEKAEN
jgi:hypothetical protein